MIIRRVDIKGLFLQNRYKSKKPARQDPRERIQKEKSTSLSHGIDKGTYLMLKKPYKTINRAIDNPDIKTLNLDKNMSNITNPNQNL